MANRAHGLRSVCPNCIICCQEAAMNSLLCEVRKYRERFLVSKGNEQVMLNVDDINYFSIENNHVVAFTDEGIPRHLSGWIEMLAHLHKM